MGTQWRTAKLVARWHTTEKRRKLNSMPLNGGISGWLVNWGGPDNVIVTYMVRCPLEICGMGYVWGYLHLALGHSRPVLRGPLIGTEFNGLGPSGTVKEKIDHAWNLYLP